jgi:ElaB/YqjD/DUF883 family membrane-anchored ribosome-binding protein
MNQTDIVHAATQAAQTSKTLLGRQVDRQAASIGSTLTQTARDLQQVGSNLRANGTIASAADVADWAASYVSRAAQYLTNGTSETFIVDLETFARERPWTVAASAAAVGFVAARVVKSSSIWRFSEASDPEYRAIGSGARATDTTDADFQPASAVANGYAANAGRTAPWTDSTRNAAQAMAAGVAATPPAGEPPTTSSNA